VLVCSWVQVKLGARNANVICNKYGFAIANFIHYLSFSVDSFAFPIQCKEGFSSKDIGRRNGVGGDLKVVYGIEVRGRRTNSKNE